MNPARTSSLWLTASASAGASRRVGKKSCDARVIGIAAEVTQSVVWVGVASLAFTGRFPRGPPRWDDARPAQVRFWRAKPASADNGQQTHVHGLSPNGTVPTTALGTAPVRALATVTWFSLVGS